MLPPASVTVRARRPVEIAERKGPAVWEWIFGVALLALYIFFLFTVCRLTFAKGHSVLGILGIFVPFLWLIGAVLPARPGSPFDRAEAARYGQAMSSPGT